MVVVVVNLILTTFSRARWFTCCYFCFCFFFYDSHLHITHIWWRHIIIYDSSCSIMFVAVQRKNRHAVSNAPPPTHPPVAVMMAMLYSTKSYLENDKLYFGCIFIHIHREKYGSSFFYTTSLESSSSSLTL